jgi:protein-tyrosine-phosphatase
MPAPGSVLIVCTANICRSPIGEALLRHALAAEGEPLKSLIIESAGVAARRGAPMTEYAIAALKKAGIQSPGHFSRPLTREILRDASVVLCMTEAHRSMIKQMAHPPPAHLYLFREFMPAGSTREIADPYGGSLAMYETSRDEMVEAIPSLIAFFKTRFGAKD